jgi:hypothetical protein
VYGYLKNAARGNASVSALVTTIGQAFLGQGRRTEATIIDLVPSGGRGVVNAVLNSYLVNEGETLLKIVMENGSRTLSLRPGDAVKVTSSSFTVTNLSTSQDGRFSVRIN